jgi:hypothetical protein
MNILRTLILLIVVTSLSWHVFAQDTADTLAFADAYEIIQAEYPDEELLELFFLDDTTYWGFYLIDLGYLYISPETNDIITNDEYEALFVVGDEAAAIEVASEIYPDAEVASVEIEEGYGGIDVWDIEFSNSREVDVAVESGSVVAFGYMDPDDDVEPLNPNDEWVDDIDEQRAEEASMLVDDDWCYEDDDSCYEDEWYDDEDEWYDDEDEWYDDEDEWYDDEDEWYDDEDEWYDDDEWCDDEDECE